MEGRTGRRRRKNRKKKISDVKVDYGERRITLTAWL
jgi:hypothetical protein